MDILPIQASAVPCERAFSSSKETDAARRANLESDLMEKLQILKNLRLFDSSATSTPSITYCATALDIDPSVIHDLLASQNVAVLEHMIYSSFETEPLEIDF